MDKLEINKEIVELPLEKLVIDLAQVRTSKNVAKKIDELAASIKKIGLLEPIIVCPTEEEEDKYEILAGQRRFLAHKKINANTIKSIVIDKRFDEFDAKTISLTENLLRVDLTSKEERDACLLLWRRYKDIDIIVEETGLPKSRIRKYLKYEQLIPPLKKMVDDGEVDLDAGVRAQKAASVSGELDEEEAIKFAKEMNPMTGVQRRNVIKKREEDPGKEADDIIEDAKTGGKVHQIVVTLGHNLLKALKSYASQEKTTQDNAAAGLIEETLTSKGYIEYELE